MRAARFVWLLLSLAQGASAAERSLELDLRYLNQRTQKDSIAQSVIFQQSLYSWLDLTAGARFWQDRSALDGLSLLGQLRVAPVPWAGTLLRVVQVNRLSESTTGTVLLGALDLRGEFFRGFGGYATIGYYKVFQSLGKNVPLPTFSNVSFTDEDLATEFGLWVRPASDWLAKAGIGTYEVIEVYNLNNPFVETRFEHVAGEENWLAAAFVRYQLLLGFGRSDTLTFGVALRRQL